MQSLSTAVVHTLYICKFFPCIQGVYMYSVCSGWIQKTIRERNVLLIDFLFFQVGLISFTDTHGNVTVQCTIHITATDAHLLNVLAKVI
jgi:hypothetical protein